MFGLTPWKKKSKNGAMVPASPAPIAELRNEIDSLFDRFWQNDLGTDHWLRPTGHWGLDVVDEEKALVVRAETPGFKPEEIDVQLSGNRLLIRAEHQNESEKDGARTLHHGMYQQTIPVPEGIEESEIDASYKNGVLEIRLPKGEAAMAKRIAVKAG